MVARAAPEPQSLPRFSAGYAPPDGDVLDALLPLARIPRDQKRHVEARAESYIKAIRNDAGGWGGVEEFLREYDLSTEEGLALMVLAEALLRIPDAPTKDKLIEEKLGTSDWSGHDASEHHWLFQTANWGLGLSSRIIHASENTEGVLSTLARRIGVPAVRNATMQAMRFLGTQFILGETIADALASGKTDAEKGYRFSYDMLGEGARTWPDAERYLEAYSSAITAIGKNASEADLPDRPGISVKLSALHPRYEAAHGDTVMEELVPRLLGLAQLAKEHNLNFTVDAEEAHRLELSLEVIAAVLADPSLAGWDGYGLAIQAYQKRAPHTVDWVIDLANALGRKLMVRLVKGAYWDSEIKRAQERGLEGYPVFTLKAATDVSFLACAKKLIAAPAIYPQFATHNALTAAALIELAGETPYEFQRLHGMGDVLHERIRENSGRPCRIYAPVGGHRDLLAYLVRRMLENGANSSFVAQAGDEDVPLENLLRHPDEIIDRSEQPHHPKIPLPDDIFGARLNSRGWEPGSSGDMARVAGAGSSLDFTLPKKDDVEAGGVTITSPVDGRTIVGEIRFASNDEANAAVERARNAFPRWAALAVDGRAALLEKTGDLFEANHSLLYSLLTAEAGKTLDDCVAEVREAVDFCRYYAREARNQQGESKTLPGPTGELNLYAHRGRGPFVCISPWNFPLAIFTGQVAAALVTGNTVLAKPAEQTSLVAREAVRLMHVAGIPQDVLQLVPGPGESVGDALVGHADVAGVAFTGSTEVAQLINRKLAAKDGPIVPLIAETGGINAMIVDATALPEQVCDDVLASAFRSAGQRCSALRLLCLQDSSADRIIEMVRDAAKLLVLGDPRDPATDIGPVIDREARDGLEAHVRKMEEAQKLLWAGETPEGALAGGSYFAPRIIELDKPSALTREVFGPVLHVVRWNPERFDALLDDIAATGYGLTVGIHSRINAVADRVVARLGVGNVYVNRNMVGAVVGSQPFGGSGLSGTGPKAGGPAYLERFAQEQVISVNTAAVGGNTSLLTLDGED